MRAIITQPQADRFDEIYEGLLRCLIAQGKIDRRLERWLQALGAWGSLCLAGDPETVQDAPPPGSERLVYYSGNGMVDPQDVNLEESAEIDEKKTVYYLGEHLACICQDWPEGNRELLP